MPAPWRARLLGLDLQTGRALRFGPSGPYEEIDPKTIEVEIIGNPEMERVRSLEEERIRPLAANDPEATPPRSVN
jgi:hypothetical protein